MMDFLNKKYCVFLWLIVISLLFIIPRQNRALAADKNTGEEVLTHIAEKEKLVYIIQEETEIVSTPREIQLEHVMNDRYNEVSAEEYEILLHIVEAEAGGEDYTGKLLVANVVLNRVASDSFPDTVKSVVYQKVHDRYQFSPVGSGRIDRVTPSEETMEAVEAALRGEDVSEGALYFAARKYADSDKMKWFDTKLTYLFAHGGHEFFTETDIAEN